MKCTDAGIQPVDIIEHLRRIVVRMPLPDVAADDVYVSIGKRSIRVLAQGKEVWEWNGKKSYVVGTSKYYRLIPLPKNCDVYAATATFEEQELEIIIPKTRSSAHA